MVIILLKLLLKLLLLQKLLLILSGLSAVFVVLRLRILLDSVWRWVHLKLLLVLLLVFSLLFLATEGVIWRPRGATHVVWVIQLVIELLLPILGVSSLHLHQLLLLLIENLLNLISILHSSTHIYSTCVLLYDTTTSSTVFHLIWLLIASLTFSSILLSCIHLLALIWWRTQSHHLHVWGHCIILLMQVLLVLDTLDGVISTSRSIDHLLASLWCLGFWWFLTFTYRSTLRNSFLVPLWRYLLQRHSLSLIHRWTHSSSP
jgi:hypothetical protein